MQRSQRLEPAPLGLRLSPGPTRKDAGFSSAAGLVPTTTFSPYEHRSDDIVEKRPPLALTLHLAVTAHLSPWVLMRMLARCLHAWHSVRDEGQDSMFHQQQPGKQGTWKPHPRPLGLSALIPTPGAHNVMSLYTQQ